jgi:hypothetical protein
MKVKVEFSKEPVILCNKVFELLFGSSCLYNSFEKVDVAIIESAVMVKPVVIDKKDSILSNASELSK